ncbi:MAG: succinate dehydrogenase assembly factor 2 [Betaproteobacteria bacterium]|nr:MAG: succinate dehydrogenase assembly factor 2 [Betaproteobacteria bacterium]
MGRIARERLYWKCRRGLLELDLVLGRYLQRHGSKLGEQELVLLNELLDHADQDLWAIVSGRSDRYDPRHAALVARLRAS